MFSFLGPNVRRAPIRQGKEDPINKRKRKRRNLDLEFENFGCTSGLVWATLLNKVNGFAGIFRGFLFEF